MDDERTVLQPGTLVGRHKILSLLGTSSLGDSYLAEQVFLGRKIVLERLSPNEPGFLNDMLTAARALTTLDHPNIPSLHDADVHQGIPYLTWEYASGWDLQQLVSARGAISLPVALRIVASIAGATQHAHSHGVVHGGICPRSILFSQAGVALLTGFWLSTPATFSVADNPYDGREMLAYRSPEQARVESPIAASDVWALGATLHFLVTGSPPYDLQSDWDLMRAIGSSDPVDLPGLANAAPEYVVEIVKRCLRKDPSQRYATPDDLRRALDAAVDHADLAGDETVEIQPPHKGQFLILHVECAETNRAGQYREFEIGPRIGSGGFGEVFRATDTYTREPVALKILRRQWLTHQDVVERFRREARLLTRVSHPNVLKVRNFGRYGGTFLIEMDLLDGHTLRQHLSERGTLQPHEAASVAGQVLAGLAAVHASGAVHRDLKPRNVMMVDGRAVVCDFGLIKVDDGTGLTMSGEVLGTIPYFSPEQARAKPITTASDIYSAGVMLYEMLTGHLPHAADNQLGLLRCIAYDDPQPIESRRDDLPTPLVLTVSAMLARDPASRPSSDAAREMLASF